MKYPVSELIMGFLKGTLDKNEVEDFYSWVNSDPENKKIFFEAKTVYDASRASGKKIDISGSWERFLTKKQKQSVGKQYNLWHRVASYAAVIFIAVALTSTLFFYQQSNSQQSVAQYVGGDGLVADKLILPDGSEVHIGSRTRVHYAPEYGKKKRVVYLEGEAFFDVAKLKGKPFIVKVNGQEVEALGTKFNIMAYPSDSVFTTTLQEGSIRLVCHNIHTPIILEPDQQFIYNRNTHTSQVKQVEANRYTSWKEGYYYFPDQTLRTILDRLTHIYGITFNVESDDLRDKKFTGTFYRGQSIKDILEIVNTSIPIKYQIDELNVKIYE